MLVVPAMAQTQMACDPAALMDQDTWLGSVLTSRPTLTLDDDTLTISAQGATVTLLDREVADPDLPLEGTVWTVDTLVTARRRLVAAGRGARADPDDGRWQPSPSTPGATRGAAATRSPATPSRSGRSPTTRMACEPAAKPGGAAGARGADRHGDVRHRRRRPDLDERCQRPRRRGAALSSPATGLVGPAWQLAPATVGGAPQAVGERVPTLTFDGTSVAVDTGCNTGAGGYTSDDAAITFQPVAITLMLCTGAAGALEPVILGALTGTVPFTIDADGALDAHDRHHRAALRGRVTRPTGAPAAGQARTPHSHGTGYSDGMSGDRGVRAAAGR